MLLEFLKTKRTKEELSLVLDILKEFKEHESEKELAFCSFESWVKLEQFEDYLKLLTEREVEDVDDNRAKEYLSALANER
jgi:predicted transcriptional regulator